MKLEVTNWKVSGEHMPSVSLKTTFVVHVAATQSVIMTFFYADIYLFICMWRYLPQKGIQKYTGLIAEAHA